SQEFLLVVLMLEVVYPHAILPADFRPARLLGTNSLPGVLIGRAHARNCARTHMPSSPRIFDQPACWGQTLSQEFLLVVLMLEVVHAPTCHPPRGFSTSPLVGDKSFQRVRIEMRVSRGLRD
ncbi:MAG: hypothetical protein AAF587_31275, partial [Bacteroidota bacterium]